MTSWSDHRENATLERHSDSVTPRDYPEADDLSDFRELLPGPQRGYLLGKPGAYNNSAG